MKYPPAIQRLIDFFSQLPSVGPKTAERYVFYLLDKDTNQINQFAQALAELKTKTTTCSICNAIAEQNPCSICANPKRDHSLVCITADTRDMLAIEATGQFLGVYYILGGEIDTINEIKPTDLKIAPLLAKLKKEAVKEVILALNPTIEGETTALYLAKTLRSIKPQLKITRLARGLPAGADLEYADELTITNALKYRNNI
jgi:recombination protein RecR